MFLIEMFQLKIFNCSDSHLFIFDGVEFTFNKSRFKLIHLSLDIIPNDSHIF